MGLVLKNIFYSITILSFFLLLSLIFHFLHFFSSLLFIPLNNSSSVLITPSMSEMRQMDQFEKEKYVPMTKQTLDWFLVPTSSNRQGHHIHLHPWPWTVRACIPNLFLINHTTLQTLSCCFLASFQAGAADPSSAKNGRGAAATEPSKLLLFCFPPFYLSMHEDFQASELFFWELGWEFLL